MIYSQNRDVLKRLITPATTNFKFEVWPWPFYLKINRSYPQTLGNICVKYRYWRWKDGRHIHHHCVSKQNESCRNNANFKVQIGLNLNTFEFKIKRSSLVMDNTCVKYVTILKGKRKAYIEFQNGGFILRTLFFLISAIYTP